MAKGKTPGSNTGSSGGIYQEVRSTGKPVSNFATVPDNRPLPPTTKPGHLWKPVKITPTGDR
jgi:hypothetical protein